MAFTNRKSLAFTKGTPRIQTLKYPRTGAMSTAVTNRNVCLSSAAIFGDIPRREAKEDGQSMRPLFSPNIGNKGRLVRGLIALGLFASGWFSFRVSTWFALLLLASGGFTLFEALRGWCVLRACGIKTKV